MGKFASIPRILHDKEISRLAASLEKPILEVGAGRKTRFYGKGEYPGHVLMDMSKGVEPDVIGDIKRMPFEEGHFSSVICTQVLEHVDDPPSAIREIRRVLKPGGVCVISVPFIYPVHSDPKDYWRFTPDSLHMLFKDFRDVDVVSYGGRTTTTFFMLSRLIRPVQKLNPLLTRFKDGSKDFALGFILTAMK